MFYLMTIQRFNTGDPEAKSLFDYSTEDDASAALYSTMASSTANVDISSVICLIMDEVCGILKYEKWNRH